MEALKASKLASDRRLVGRLVGPIRDAQGRIVSFWARHPEGHRPHYLYLNAHWQRHAVFYGLDVLPADVLTGSGNLLIVRDLLDALLLRCRGFHNVVATGKGGERISVGQWQRAHELGVRRATLAWPHSRDGLRDVLIALENALRAEPAPTVYVVPRVDWFRAVGPGEFVRTEGPAALHDFVRRRRVDGCQYLLEHLSANGHAFPAPWPSSEAQAAELPQPAGARRPIFHRHDDDADVCTMHQCRKTVCFCFD